MNGGSGRLKQKKHKVIMHTSPFLRCIQTAVAVSAGMSQYHGLNDSGGASTASNKRNLRSLHSESTHRRGDHSRSPSLNATIEEEDESYLSPDHGVEPSVKPFHKTQLRLDAFLGEWLSPDYYESITPPPDSILMLAGAKAELLHRSQHVDFPDDALKVVSDKGNFPGGWGSGHSQPTEFGDSAIGLAGLSLRSPTRDRASTLGGTGDWSSRAVKRPDSNPKFSGYLPPIPRYAISPTDPIPPGYVAHAKDACVDVDYQWDSTRKPQDWGNGGEYGEEWSSMHRRFRKGLQHMIEWYSLHHESAFQLHGHKRVLHPLNDDEDDENTDTVLVLITHGAGCNALIGALTNQPVLLDVGMASLTMAVRKDDSIRPDGDENSRTLQNGHFQDDRNLALHYHVLLTASTEHLRAGSTPLSIPLLQQPHASANLSHFPTLPVSRKPLLHRYHLVSPTILTSSPIDTLSDADFVLPERALRPPGGPGLQRSVSSVTRTKSGLWSKPEGNTSPKSQPSEGALTTSQGKDREGESRLSGINGSKDTDVSEHEKDEIPPLGLWGAKSPEVQDRERGLKRRWTVNDRT